MTSSPHIIAPPAPRFRALDGIRGVAALLVVLLHVEWNNHLTGLHFVRNGYLAVDLFFILSGLVISANYSAKLVDRAIALRFIGLRLFRLYPLHIFVLAGFVALECVKLGAQHTVGARPEHDPFTGGQSPLSALAHVFLVQGLGWLPTPGWNGPSWSISCEFFMYIVFAALTVTGLAGSRLFRPISAITALSAYAVLALTRGTLDIVFDLGFVRCFAGFTLGMLIHSWVPLHRGPLRYSALLEVAVAGATIAAMAVASGPMILVVVPLFVGLVALLRSDEGPIARLLLTSPVQYLGRISYSIYMVHQVVVICILMVLKRVGPMAHDPLKGRVTAAIDPWVGDILVFALIGTVVLLASRTYAWIEEPGREFGRRLLRGKGKGVRHAAALPAMSIGMTVRTPQ